MSYVAGHENEENLAQADLPFELPERHHDQCKADQAENASSLRPTISMAVVSDRDAKRRGLKRTSRCFGWAISSSQPHRERFNQSSDCHDLAEVTLHSIGMLGCVSAHHADS